MPEEGNAWIGLMAIGNNTYKWEDETPVDYFNWSYGEPNDQDGSEVCVEVSAQLFQVNLHIIDTT